MIKKCLICDKEFRTYPYRIKKYCSRECYRKSKIGSKLSEKTRRKMREAHKRNGNTTYGFQKGIKHYNWKGGDINQSGYVMVYSPEHPCRVKRNYVFEHRLVVERIIGRYLTPKDTVHHINEIRNDNRPENLYLFSNRGLHSVYHILLRNHLIKPIVKSNLLNNNN